MLDFGFLADTSTNFNGYVGVRYHRSNTRFRESKHVIKKRWKQIFEFGSQFFRKMRQTPSVGREIQDCPVAQPGAPAGEPDLGFWVLTDTSTNFNGYVGVRYHRSNTRFRESKHIIKKRWKQIFEFGSHFFRKMLQRPSVGRKIQDSPVAQPGGSSR